MLYPQKKMEENTRIIQKDPFLNTVGGKPVRTINPPVYRGSTILFKNFADFQSIFKGEYPGIIYGTHRLPTQRAFEEAVCELEKGALSRTFQSGISAIANTLMAYTQTGDHILVCDNAYGPTADFCKKVLSKYGVKTTFIPADSGIEIEQWIQPETVLILLESPGSNTFEIQDLRAVSKIARKRNIITILDNTWATPLFLKPLELGIDISIHSVTKYISGHSDILSGVVTVNEQYAEQLSTFYDTMEIYASPDDCATALRGLQTLSVRLKQHEQSALKLAQWLEHHPLIDQVLHPALESHPQHHLWKRDFKGSSGIFSFVFKLDYSDQTIGKFIDALELMVLGFSWGGYQSLVTAGKYERSGKPAYEGRYVIRLNIGLEDAEDLKEDLTQAFKHLS